MYERDVVVRDLKSYVIEFNMKSNEGNPILFRATLKENMLPENYKDEKHIQEQFHLENPEALLCYAFNQKRWITLNIKDIQYLQIIDAY